LKINCKVYAKERQLLGLRRQLEDPRLDEHQRKELREEIIRLERTLGLYEPEKNRPQGI
jgi:hypothetical protein